MCKDEPSEGTAGDGAASTRAHLSSASGSSGWSSRLPSPDPIISDPIVAPGRRIPRSPLASHAESLMDMQIPQPSASLQVGRKREIDEVFEDSTPPSPDKLQRELDQQHHEAKEAINADRGPAMNTSAPLNSHTHSQAQEPDSKRRKTLAYRAKPPIRSASPRSEDGSEHGREDDSGRENTVERLASHKSNSPSNG
ncbi:hypothetical protein CORC01_02564 [Colletotrichum orchidophilum]|uniref:Uncharacterized protein n=1 Tax=Colletotrichum orchidophilum TaxID=1209926 RepID=A0A1G4BLK2_9PEZI|nr:uncharacterized protein CORC01_02564 [Colletotrichum orchidophilum]OHF02284.1 hypothetical protein CORC01_02564 [Colletotrichum orchidophilum]